MVISLGMELIGGKECYRVKPGYSLGEGDIARASALYLPLIGAMGVGVYSALFHLAKEGDGKVRFFDGLFSFLGANPGPLVDSLSKLEAVGLIRTFKTDGEPRLFDFLLFPPLSPESFFASYALSHKAKQALGEGYGAWRSLLLSSASAEGKEISASFGSVYSPDPKSIGPKTGFSRDEFASGLSSVGNSIRQISDDELSYCADVAEFYSLPSSVAGCNAAECLDPNAKFGERLNKERFEYLCSESYRYPHLRRGEGEKSEVGKSTNKMKAIRLYDQMKPITFLSYRQNGGKISPNDLSLLRTLRFDMGLSDPVINALLAFTLDVKKNTLPPKYVTMMAGILKRNDIKTSRDAIEYLVQYLKQPYGRKKDAGGVSPAENEAKPKPAPAKKEKEGEEEIDEEQAKADFEALFGD